MVGTRGQGQEKATVDNKVSYLSHKTAGGSRWSVEQMLADALAEVAEQRTTLTKALRNLSTTLRH